MSDYSKCKWCGNSFEKGAFSKFLSKNTAGLAGKEDYCSEKCRQEAERGNNNAPSNISNSPISSNTDSEEKRVMEEKIRIESKIENIAGIQFGNTTDEISNVLNELITIASGKPDKAVKKAIYEKMEFAIMKLKKLGSNEEANFFETKRTAIKPKWYD
jgi:hypothetical protein